MSNKSSAPPRREAALRTEEILAAGLERARETEGYGSLTRDGLLYLTHAFSSNPSRLVGVNSLRSVTSAYPSKKSGVTLQSESDGVERRFILKAELDPTVVCYLDQPPPILVRRHDTKGRVRPQRITPDFLVVRSTAIQLVECKKLPELGRLALKYPQDWESRSPLEWCHHPSDRAAELLGMEHAVFVAESISPAEAHNLPVLIAVKDYVWSAKALSDSEKIRVWIERGGAKTLMQICNKFPRATGGMILKAVERQLLWADLSRQIIDGDMLVFADRAACDSHVAMLGANAAEPHGSALSVRLATASSTEIKAAQKRMETYDKRRAKGLPLNSTDYRLREQIQSAEDQKAERLAAFIPAFRNRGRSKIYSETLTAGLKRRIVEFWKTNARPTICSLYAWLSSDEAIAKTLPSMEKIRRLLQEALAPDAAAFMTGGKRAFHAARQMTDGANANIRPSISGFDAHIDGVYGDQFSKELEEDLFLRPIFYPIIDDETGFVFGDGVKVGHPSYLAVAGAMRSCIRRMGGLPRRLMRDWGPEFENNALRETAALAYVELASRPKSAPRFGGRGESFNNAFNSYLQTLAGGTYFDKAGRAADANKKGRATAQHDIAEVIRNARFWIYEVWNKTPIGGSTQSPEDLMRQQIRLFPEAIVPVQMTPRMRYATSYPLKIGKFEYNRGAKFGGLRFHSDELAALLRSGKKPSEPRLDCENPSIIWASSPEGPIQLRSLDFLKLEAKDEPEQIAMMRGLLLYSRTAADNQLERHKRAYAARQLPAQESCANNITSEGGQPGPIREPEVQPKGEALPRLGDLIKQ